MTLKRTICAAITALSALFAGAAVVPDSIVAHYADRAPDTIEGVWQFADDGATIAIYADTNTTGDYTLVCLDSPDLRLAPGTTLGAAKSSLGDGVNYTTTLCTNVNDKGTPISQHKFNVTLTNNILSLTAVKSGLKFDVWMLYRFFVTMSVHRNNATPTLKARRIYPPTPTPNAPLIL